MAKELTQVDLLHLAHLRMVGLAQRYGWVRASLRELYCCHRHAVGLYALRNRALVVVEISGEDSRTLPLTIEQIAHSAYEDWCAKVVSNTTC